MELGIASREAIAINVGSTGGAAIDLAVLHNEIGVWFVDYLDPDILIVIDIEITERNILCPDFDTALVARKPGSLNEVFIRRAVLCDNAGRRVACG
jgi:hypothetical protein